MVSQIRRGVLDFIGAARPSIADPFLPQKIEEGRGDDIRECIGCNICVTGDMTSTPIRCTQNPTMGEEWRKGWHPERIAPKQQRQARAGRRRRPGRTRGGACARSARLRSASCRSARELGGRVSLEARLPGLAEWARVRDWRVGQINKMANVAIYRDNRHHGRRRARRSAPSASCSRPAVIGGATVTAAATASAIPGFDRANVFTPDDLLRGVLPDGPVLLFDDDAFYIGSVLAEVLRAAGREVIYVTPGRCRRFLDDEHA